jgi:hypothetical protein
MTRITVAPHSLRWLSLPVSLALTLVLVGASCETPPSFPERATQARFAPDGEDFWDRPLPSDLRRQDDGTSDVEKWPGPWENDLVLMWLRATGTRLDDGWGLSSGGFFTLTDAIDEGSLPDEPIASLDAAVFLVDIGDSPDRGKLIPVRARVVPEDLYTPENLLAVLPVFGHLRREKSTYAFVVTDAVKDTSGEPLGASRAFFDALTGAEEANARAKENLAPLKAFLDEEGFDLSRVACAGVFDTFDPNETLVKLSQFAESEPEPTLVEPWTLAEDYESFQVLVARYSVPIIQSGARPYSNAGEGAIVWGDDGKLVVVDRQNVRLSLTIPKSPQPANGFPLMIYMHGSGGEWYEAIDRGPTPEVPLDEREPGPPGVGPSEWTARRGVATLGFDFPLHGDRNTPPDTTGLMLYNLFGNIEATLDNFTVAAMEVSFISRLALSTTVDASLSPNLDAGGATDGLIRFDPARLTAFGQSMGTTLGVAAATVDPRIKGFVFSGAGGMLIEIAVTALEPLVLGPLVANFVELEAEDLHIDHPLLHTFQALWDLVDPVVKAPYIARRPHAGKEVPHVFMSAGIRDGYFHPRSQAAVATSLGATLVGDEIEPILPASLALDGRETVAFPLVANIDDKTVGVVQYPAENVHGHYVMFNREDARFQYTCFVATVGLDDETPILGPQALDAPCP